MTKFKYEKNSEGVTITGYSGKSEIIEIPAKIDGLSVTEIGVGAFLDYKNLKEIIFPDSIKKIGDYAFCDCGNLEKVNMPNRLKEIGECAFYRCESLVEIEIPKSVEKISYNVFDSCGALDRVYIDVSKWSGEEIKKIFDEMPELEIVALN